MSQPVSGNNSGTGQSGHSGGGSSSSKHKLVQLAIQRGVMTAAEGKEFFSLWGNYVKESQNQSAGGESAMKVAFRSSLDTHFGVERAREIIKVMVRQMNELADMCFLSFLMFSIHFLSFVAGFVHISAQKPVGIRCSGRICCFQ